MSNHQRVLIVGTVPYNKNAQSRAFDAYFRNWPQKNLRQIFSNTKIPVKGHCDSLYQITDQRLLRRIIKKNTDTGVIFHYDDLPEENISKNADTRTKLISKLYTLGKNKSSLNHLLRKVLWNKKYWNTSQLNTWLDDFQPECVFLAFSDDFFIPEIALYVAEKFNIPIMTCIGDDYYFNDKFSLSPLYHLYRRKYKKLIRQIFSHRSSAIYIGDKIRDKYNYEFGLNGETIYLATEIERHPFRAINTDNLKISYCGNIRLGRNTSLVDIGNALQAINPNYKLDVYSAEQSAAYTDILTQYPGINYHGVVPYQEVVKILSGSDIVVVVEGFKVEEVTKTKYSLSTKAADSIATGGQILAYGSGDCGVIEYLESTGCAVVCQNPVDLKQSIEKLLQDQDLQKRLYHQAVKIASEHHDSDRNLNSVKALFDRLVEY